MVKRAVNRKKFGEFEVRKHPGGGATVYGPGLRARGFYLPSDDRLKDTYKNRWNGGWDGGNGSCGFVKQVAVRGVFEPPHKISVPNGRNALGIPHPKNGPVPLEEIQEAIREFWPSKNVARFLIGEDDAVKPIKDFMTEHRREYHSAHRAQTHEGLTKVMEGVYPGLYYRLKGAVDPKSLDPKEVARVLLDRYKAGLPISSTELKDSPRLEDRLLRRKVLILADGGLFKKSISYTRAVEKLTGLSRHDFSIGAGARKDSGTLAELLTEFTCTWAPLVGVDLDGRLGVELIQGNGERARIHLQNDPPEKNSQSGIHADLRIGNQSVEVKSGTGYFPPSEVGKIVERYDPKKIVWNSGEPLSGSTVVFFMEPERYERVAAPLGETSIDVVPYKWIRRKLANVIKKIPRTFSDVVDSVSPRVHSLDSLLRLSDEIALKPSVIARQGNDGLREWAKNVLRYLNARGADLRNDGAVEPIDRANLVELTGGEVYSAPEGSFLYLERSAEDLEAGRLWDYTREHLHGLTVDRIREVFDKLPAFAKKRMGIVDIETAGLSPQSPIITVSLTQLDHNLTNECFVARDPSEERAMLAYTLERIGELDVVVTYNGTSFDVPRIIHRVRQNGLFVNGHATAFRGFEEGRHLDLYREVVARKRWKHDAKLTTFEKLVVGYNRQNDVSGAEIPKIYGNYVFGEDNAFDFNRVVYHNMLDTLSGAAVLGYLCRKK